VAEAALARPEMRFVYPPQLRQWQDYESHPEIYRSFRASDKNRDRMTKAVWDTGQRVLLGTDTANPFLVPGFSIHGELRHQVEAGLTPFEALRAGTHNAAKFLGRLDDFGAIAEGQRADLILLRANPLDDVKHVQGRVGVMLRGRWYPEAKLQRKLEDLAASYAEQSPSVEPDAGN
jgi:imidazolonepropionase-like amidohydrolase